MYTDSDIQVSSKEHAYSEVDEEEMEWNSRGNGINLLDAINFSFLLIFKRKLVVEVKTKTTTR